MVPWLLWAVFRATQPDSSRRAWVALAIFAALCFLADVRLSAYAFVTAAIYLWRGAGRGYLLAAGDCCRALSWRR